MKLATLAYEIARDAIENPSGFNFEGFVRGDYDNDRDYSSQISFAFNYINLFFARLLTERKTKLKIAKAVSDANGYIEFPDGKVTAVVDAVSPHYQNVRFFEYLNGIALEKKWVSKVVSIEYRPLIPHFSLEDIRKLSTDAENDAMYEEVVINLEDYGITDEMCAYVKEFAKGGLMEYLSPELSEKHAQKAEGYLNRLPVQHTQFPQREIKNVMEGDWL